MQQWSLGVQRELFASTTLELNYIGTKGTNLLMRRNVAQALPYDAANPLPVAARKPYPNFIVYIDSDWSGRSNYNAFNTKLEHRGRGALLTLAYTWAKSTDSKSAAAGIGNTPNGWQGFLNNHDPERDHALSDFDVDHRMVASFVYNLPFGNGEKFAGDATGLTNALIGGWQMNGIYTWQNGFPLTVAAVDLGGLNDAQNANRANLVGDPNNWDSSITQWFNVAAFAQPAAGTYGDVGRNTLRLPGINNVDLALFKNFELGHGMRLQFRLESFNALNHTQFNSVNTSLTSPSFGVVNGARAGRINQLGSKIDLLNWQQWPCSHAGERRRVDSVGLSRPSWQLAADAASAGQAPPPADAVLFEQGERRTRGRALCGGADGRTNACDRCSRSAPKSTRGWD